MSRGLCAQRLLCPLASLGSCPCLLDDKMSGALGSKDESDKASLTIAASIIKTEPAGPIPNLIISEARQHVSLIHLGFVIL